MNTLEAIRTRRSTRKFKAQPVEIEKLQAIVEAGRFGPTGGNAQTNHFFVISDASAIAKLKELVQSAFAAMELREDLYKSLKNSITLARKGNYSFCYTAPVLIVVANKKDYGNAMADSACVLENMMIAANALDLGSCWINQLHWLTDHALVRDCMKQLGMEDDEFVTGGLILGYGAEGIPERGTRKPTGNPVSWIE
jgi:nitroreductase